MPIIRPSSISITENTPRSEIDIYNLFKEKLSDDYYVNYKRYWFGKNNKGKLFTREIDFVVALKEEGILFLEVKGGEEIFYNPEDKQWYSKRSDTGQINRIENPIEQAKDAMFHFKEKLQKESGWKKNVRFQYGCVFPGMRKSNDKSIGEFPAGVFLFKDDLADIQNSLKRLLSYAGQKKTFDLFDHEQMNIFMESLDQRYFAEIPFKDKLADANKKIIELSNEQLETYDMMYDPVNARLAVSGGAGTGKTILATHLAYKCATDLDSNVLLLSRNRSQRFFLLDFFKNKEGRIPDVKYIFDLVKEKCREVSVPFMFKKNHENEQEYFDKALPEFAADIFSKCIEDKKYDTIIIDEGQDFNEDWFIAIEFLFKKDPKKYVVFYDNNQKLFKKDEILSLEGFMRIILHKNYRNTKKIFNIIEKLFTDSSVTPAGPEGLNNPPIAIEIRNDQELEEAIVVLANQLVKKEKIEPSDIGFITLTSERMPGTVKERELLEKHRYKVNGVEEGKIPGSFSRGGPTYFKGLEREIMIILNVKNISELSINSLYVALSRAKHQFIIVCSSDEIESLKKRLGLNPPKDMFRIKFKGLNFNSPYKNIKLLN